MRVLVTGCAGFIGWKVSTLLIEQGHTVTGVDNLDNATDVGLKRWRLSQLEARPQFRFHHGDVTQLSDLQGLFRVAESPVSLDAVINMAARTGVRPSLKDPWAYYQTNLIGTLNLLELCRENGVPKFVLSSTSSVYGDGEIPFREDGPTDRPVSPYAASKKAAEGLCYTYHQLYDLDVTVLRYFTVYGPGGRPDMSVFRFIKWIAEGEPLVLYGDGHQERDFTYVDDIAAGTVAALRPLAFQVINLGNDRPASVLKLISVIEGLLETDARVERLDPQPGDVQTTWAHISKAREVLDWSPQTPLEDGLKKSVQWYKQNRDWARHIRTH